MARVTKISVSMGKTIRSQGGDKFEFDRADYGIEVEPDEGEDIIDATGQLIEDVKEGLRDALEGLRGK